MLGCKVTTKNGGFGYYTNTSSASSEQKVANISSYRHKLILFLVKAGKTDQALNVITLPQTAELPKDVLTNTTPKGQLHVLFIMLLLNTGHPAEA